MTKTLAYHVYSTSHPTLSGYEGTRELAHNARRLRDSLARQGFRTSVQAVKQDDAGTQWCEEVSL